MYCGMEVWCPQRSRDKCTRSSRGRCCSCGDVCGGGSPRSVLGGKESSVLRVIVVCMCVLSEVLGGVGGRECKDCS